MINRYYLLIAVLLATVLKVAAQNELPFTSLNLQTLKDFKTTSGNWQVAGDVYFDINTGGNGTVKPGKGILVNSPTEKSKDHLFSNFQHGDIELELDFMMDKGSNAGVYLQGRYEIQMFDSWGIRNPKVTDCGAICQRWDESKPDGFKGFHGHAPSQNVSKAPGLWQHFRIVFRAPRFDQNGKKIANAKFVQVFHNGVLVHENIELTGPTRAAAFEDEKPLGPLMIQGDHGAVAIRNIKYKAYGLESISLKNLSLKSFEGSFKSFQELNSQTPKKETAIKFIDHSTSGSKDKFGGKISGTINLPKTGKYFFDLNLKWIPTDTDAKNPNGAGELVIGGKKILLIDGKTSPTVSTITEFKAGEYPFTLTYYKSFDLWYANKDDIFIGVEGPGIPYSLLNPVIKDEEATGEIRIISRNEPVMQRGFINHNGKKRTHTISVGEGNANYSIDLSKGEFLQFWRGDFLETTPMWAGRGETQLSLPIGSVTELPGKPSLALLNDKDQVWPDSNASFNYAGYEVVEGRPIIKYGLGDASVKESFMPEDGGKRLTHLFSISTGKELWCRVAEASEIEKLDNGLYAINCKEFYVDLTGVQNPYIRSTQNKKELLIPVKDNAQYSIVW